MMSSPGTACLFDACDRLFCGGVAAATYEVFLLRGMSYCVRFPVLISGEIKMFACRQVGLTWKTGASSVRHLRMRMCHRWPADSCRRL